MIVSIIEKTFFIRITGGRLPRRGGRAPGLCLGVSSGIFLSLQNN